MLSFQNPSNAFNQDKCATEGHFGWGCFDRLPTESLKEDGVEKASSVVEGNTRSPGLAANAR